MSVRYLRAQVEPPKALLWVSRQVTGRRVFGFIVFLHLVATCLYFPPWETFVSKPLFHIDHPVHAHRVYVYRQAFWESGPPWGYDPAVGAGTAMHPGQDLGAKPQQLLGLIFGFVAPGQVVRLFLFLAIVTSPLGTLLASRRLGFDMGQQACILAALLALTWGVVVSYFDWGLVSFATASFWVPWVLVLFLDFLEEPGYRRFLACLTAAALLFLCHSLSPVVLVPSLVLLTIAKRNFPARWRIALVLVPVFVVLLNVFWLLPAVVAETTMPRPPRDPSAALEPPEHLVATEWTETFGVPSFGRVARVVVGLPFAAYGLMVLSRLAGRRVLAAFGLSAAFAIALRYFGSFVPVVVTMQPVRFAVPGLVLLAIPIGLALESLGRRWRLPGGVSAALAGVMLCALAVWLDRPGTLPLPPSPDPVGIFLASHTEADDRLLFQSRDGYRSHGYEAKVFPLTYGREVIGSTFPDFTDPAQFHRDWLWARKLNMWQPEELKASLERWGISWVFVQTDEARLLLTAATGEPGRPLGRYHAFRVQSRPSSRFLRGKGRVVAKVNRLELSDVEPADEIVVLRYRYHPAWRATNGHAVLQYPVPEDPTGFIALKNPDRTVSLHFDPAALLRDPWPEPALR